MIKLFILMAFVASCSQEPPLPGIRKSVFSYEEQIKDSTFKVAIPEANNIHEWAMYMANAHHFPSNVDFSTRPQKVFEKSLNWFWQDSLYSSPVVKGNAIYLINDDAKVVALNFSGSELWSTKIKGGRDSYEQGVASIAAGSDALVGITRSGVMFALSYDKGALLWSSAVGKVAKGEITLADGKIIFTDINNDLLAFSAAGGEKIFETSINTAAEITLAKGASPIVVDDKIVAGFSSGELGLFDLQSGKLLYLHKAKTQTLSADYLSRIDGVVGSPVYANGRIYYASYNGPFSMLEIEGNKLRSVWQMDIGSINTPLVAGNVVYVMTKEAHLMALDAASGRLIWGEDFPLFEDSVKRTKRINYFGPVMGGGILILSSSDGYNIHINAANGKVLINQKLHSGAGVSPIIVEKHLFIVTKKGRVIGYR